MISLLSLVNNAPRCASTLPFLSLMLCHFECPDMVRLSLTFAVRDDPAGSRDPEPVRPHALVPVVVRPLRPGQDGIEEQEQPDDARAVHAQRPARGTRGE